MNIIHNNTNTCRLTRDKASAFNSQFLHFCTSLSLSLSFFPPQCLWKQVYKRLNKKRTVLGIGSDKVE